MASSMGRKPGDAAIAEFVAFTGADQQEAISYLTRESDIQKAVQNFYEAQERGTSAVSSYAPPVWDESEMHAGKEYGPETNPQPTYKIHAADHTQTLGPDIFASSLSRPPSRVDLRLDDKQESDPRQGLLNPSFQSRTDDSTPNFRAATRDHYPEKQWSMVSTSHHILPDPEPKQRTRMLGSPAFIKPSTDGIRVSALLTIYQQIPLACEALLVRDHVRAEYGTSKDWWQGDSVRTRGVVVSLDGSQPTEGPTPVIDEVQRWMAFLELTERAYGSCVALTEELASRSWASGSDTTASLLKLWISECTESRVNSDLKNVFTTSASEKRNGTIVNDDHFQIVSLLIRDSIPGTTSLYDLLDEVLWQAWDADQPSEMTLKSGGVITFDFTREGEFNPQSSIELPTVWYGDRYMEENADKALAMLREFVQIDDERRKLQSQQDILKYVSAASSQNTVSAVDLFKVVRRYLSDNRPPTDELEERDDAILSGAAYHPLDDYKRLTEKLQEMADNILRQHEALEQVKTQLDTRKEVATDWLKGDSTSTEDKPKHRYTLRGVAVDQHTTYVLANPNTAEDLLGTRAADWDWWMIGWDAQKDNPIDLRKVKEADVLDAAHKARKMVAVYASDEAVNYPRQPVPAALKNFIRADNLHFTSEIEHPELSDRQMSENTEWGYPQPQPKEWRSRSRSGSPDSMAANMDTEMNDRWDSVDETHPPSYSSTPPPMPPRTGEYRKTPAVPLLQDAEDLIKMEDDAMDQQSGTINLMDDETENEQEMKEISSAPLRAARFPVD